MLNIKQMAIDKYIKLLDEGLQMFDEWLFFSDKMLV